MLNLDDFTKQQRNEMIVLATTAMDALMQPHSSYEVIIAAIAEAVRRERGGWQPKEPTPEERAKTVVEWMVSHGVVNHFSGIEHVEARKQIENTIQAAIDADRAQRGS